MDQKKSRFGIGLFIGTLLGGLAAFFLSPKSGEENREAVLKKMRELKKRIDEMEIDKKVKEIYGEATEEGRKVFTKAKKGIINELEVLEEKWEHLDKEKYIKIVEGVVSDIAKETKESAEKMLKLKKAFMQDWEEIFGQEDKPAKKKS